MALVHGSSKMKNYLAMPVERIPSARDKSGIFDNSN